jgi:hypothetical protein
MNIHLKFILDGPSPHTYCVYGFVTICLVGSNIIFHYKYIYLQIVLKSLCHTDFYRFETPYLCKQNKKINILAMPKFEPGENVG